MVALTGLLFWLVTDEAFRVSEERITISGLALASEAEVRAHLGGISRSPNVFRVRGSELVEDLHELPQVGSASATVTLPADVRIKVTERQPLFVWTDGRDAWLVDETGLLFAEAPGIARSPEAPDGALDPAASPGPVRSPEATTSAARQAPAGPTGSAAPAPTGGQAASFEDMPVVEDDRIVSQPPGVGSLLPPIDLAVMRQLLAVTPRMLDSESQGLRLRIDDRAGYVLLSEDLAWRAIFGHYTPSIQPPEVVPLQVQCLHWIVAQWEQRLEVVRLAPSEESCGTAVTRGGRG